jgi:SAM-dependent methyltransferase
VTFHPAHVTFREVEAWVTATLPQPPARVLEVGAGDGALARRLRVGGWDVTAIDPKSGAAEVLPVALVDLPESAGSFDAAVAVVSLHHVEPLETSVERLAAALEPGALLLVDEFDVDALDERAATWWLAQRHALGGDDPETPTELMATMREKVHSIDVLTGALRPWFEIGEPQRGTYLYRWKLDESLHPLESGLVARGVLPATGVRLVAKRS